MPSASQRRAREFFIAACEEGETHPYSGLSQAEIHEIEKGRRPIPNRATARKHGIRSGYTRRLAARLAMAAEIRRADRKDDTIAMQAARKAKREATAA